MAIKKIWVKNIKYILNWQFVCTKIITHLGCINIIFANFTHKSCAAPYWPLEVYMIQHKNATQTFLDDEKIGQELILMTLEEQGLGSCTFYDLL